MNVSNEQAKSIKICYQIGNQCSCLCDWFSNNCCPYQSIKPTKMELDLAADLLEARELIKEINKMLMGIFIGFAKDIPTPCDIELRNLIEKTKDYAK